jgi:hypothetical protein
MQGQEGKVVARGAPRYVRFSADFEEWFPQGLYLVGEIQAVTEYQVTGGQGA